MNPYSNIFSQPALQATASVALDEVNANFKRVGFILTCLGALEILLFIAFPVVFGDPWNLAFGVCNVVVGCLHYSTKQQSLRDKMPIYTKCLVLIMCFIAVGKARIADIHTDAAFGYTILRYGATGYVLYLLYNIVIIVRSQPADELPT